MEAGEGFTSLLVAGQGSDKAGVFLFLIEIADFGGNSIRGCYQPFDDFMSYYFKFLFFNKFLMNEGWLKSESSPRKLEIGVINGRMTVGEI